MSQPPQGSGWGNQNGWDQNPFAGGSQQGGQGQGGQPSGQQPNYGQGQGQPPYGSQGAQPGPGGTQAYPTQQQPSQGYPSQGGQGPLGGPGGAAPQGPTAKTGMSAGLKKGLIIGTAAVVLVGGGVGAFIAADPLGFRSADTAVAKMVPDDATAYVHLDMAPSPAQQAELIRFALKFPSFRENPSVREGGDLREAYFDSWMDEHPGCSNVTFDADIKPWLGDNFAAFWRPAETDPTLIVSAKDKEEAEAAVSKLNACGAVTANSTAYRDGHLIVSPAAGGAERTSGDALTASLADKAEFKEDFAKLGATGLASVWSSGQGVEDLIAQSGAAPSTPTGNNTLRSLAGTIRFSGGNPEAVVVTKSTEPLPVAAITNVGDLPGDTSLAIGIGGGKSMVGPIVDNLDAAGMDPETFAASTGLQLPGDLETLLGDDFILSADRLDEQSLSDPSRAPIGLSIKTDASKLKVLVDRFGNSGLPLVQRDSNGISYLAMNPDYASKLQNPGSRLKDSPGFQAAVAEPGKAQMVAYWDMTAYADLLSAEADPEDRADLAVLQSVGLSSFNDGGDYTRVVARMTAR
ncbi:DUF3352 domain-containing protein [Ammonicoccus fulvus]|uniref:DUF3352 domain-containing protein n=1 Tax=Ammonicoccus fulvus TaxID=3138240 RepID=A0ABZ3FTC3_9ACTN